MFNARKAAQVIAYLALKSPASALDVIKAVKLVYLSDRESVARWGAPILDERRVSMPHGPVNSETYSHINGEVDLNVSGWADFLESRANHIIAVKGNVDIDDLDELSDADVKCLDETWRRFGHFGKWDLRDWTHQRDNIPEWEDPQGSSATIPLERMLSFVGISNPDEQAREIRDYDQIDNLFATLR